MSKLILEVELDDQGAIKGLKKVDDGIEKVGKEADQTTKKTKNLKKGFAGIKVGALAAVAGLAALGKGLISVIKLAGEQEQAEAQLNAVLESTGEAAGLTSKELTDLAASLQEISTFGDEAIIRGEALLLTFTSIGKDVFPAATQTMLDMSTAMGTGLKESAIQLGKALNDPVLGISALSRVGVSFTEDQKNVIKSLVETGDVAGAQTVILNELNKEFGGQAAAAANTMTGSMEQASNAMGDAGEAIGTLLAPAVIKISRGFKDAANAVIFFLNTLERSDSQAEADRLIALNDELDRNLVLQKDLETIALRSIDQDQELADLKLGELDIRRQIVEVTEDEADAKLRLQAITAANVKVEDLEIQTVDILNQKLPTLNRNYKLLSTEIETGTNKANEFIRGLLAVGNAIKSLLSATDLKKQTGLEALLNIANVALGISSAVSGFGVIKSFLGFADGVSSAAGGMSIVGERGPEIRNLDKGDSITPAPESETAIEQGALGNVVNNFNMQGALLAGDASTVVAGMVKDAVDNGRSKIQVNE